MIKGKIAQLDQDKLLIQLVAPCIDVIISEYDQPRLTAALIEVERRFCYRIVFSHFFPESSEIIADTIEKCNESGLLDAKDYAELKTAAAKLSEQAEAEVKSMGAAPSAAVLEAGISVSAGMT